MRGFASIDDARAFFAGDRFATESGMTLEELDESHAVTSVEIGARHRNALGGVMGTARYKKDGRSSCVVNVDIVDDSGREIAQFVGTGFKLRG